MQAEGVGPGQHRPVDAEVQGPEQGRGAGQLPDEVCGHLLRAPPHGGQFPISHRFWNANYKAAQLPGHGALRQTDRRGSSWARLVRPEASKSRTLSALYEVTKSVPSP